MGREKESRIAKGQSKAGMGIAYGQINERGDGEKSVQSWYKNSLWAEKKRAGWRKVSPKLTQDSLWADKRECGCREISPKQA